jgi:Tfp pilus assembly protein PilF
LDEAVFQARKAVELDPMNYHASSQLAHRLAATGKTDDAIAMMTDALEKEPNYPLIHPALAQLYTIKGDSSKAFYHAQRGYELRSNHQFAAVLADKRPEESYQSVLKRLADLYVARADSMYISPMRAAGYCGRAGEVESTLQWLEKALDIRETRIVYAMITPGPFEHLKSNERFLNIIRRTNMIQ